MGRILKLRQPRLIAWLFSFCVKKFQEDEGETGMNNQSKLIDNEDIKMQYKDTINLQKKIYSDDRYI